MIQRMFIKFPKRLSKALFVPLKMKADKIARRRRASGEAETIRGRHFLRESRRDNMSCLQRCNAITMLTEPASQETHKYKR